MKNNPLLYLFAMTWKYSHGNRGKVITFWLMFLASECVSLFVRPFLFARLIKVIADEGVNAGGGKKLTWLLVSLIVVTGVDWAFHGPARVMERTNAWRARLNYRAQLLKGVLLLDLDWHAGRHSGDTIDRIEKGTNALYGFAEDTFEVVYSIVKLFGAYGVLLYFSPMAAGVSLVMLLLVVCVVIRFDRVLVPQYRQLALVENRISAKIFDSISNIATVVILRVENAIFHSIMAAAAEPRDLFSFNAKLNEWKWFLASLCCALNTVLVLSVFFWQHRGAGAGVLLSSAYLLIQYLGQIEAVFFRLTSMYGDIVQARTRVENSEALALDFTSETFTNHVLPVDWKILQVRDLSFGYAGQGESLQLQEVGFELLRGQRVAFVGESGGGKTTCLKVMRDLYHPQQLLLSVDGKEVAEGFTGIARAMSLVPQAPEIFATTIWENLTLGVEYSKEVVVRACEMACFLPVVESLPKGFDSTINEKGVNLSGGQQQRLALARGLLASLDKDIVLLDEPTSSLDVATERAVYEHIFAGFPRQTIVSSVHRLHLLPLFDRVVMFSGGRVVAAGRFAELLASSAEFQALLQKYQGD